MNSIYSVGQVNNYIKNMFTQDFLLNRISVKGEVSNCKYHTSGHIYFSLKDSSGTIACVMFAGARKGIAFRMKDGDRVVVSGSVNVYERDGKYQLYAKEIRLEGAGLLYERFLALKKELEEMGMFAPEYKQPIPAHIRTLGVVTAPTGAAIQDIRNVAGRRNPFVQIILYPALVQGEGAKESIVQGIQRLDDYGVDVIIVGRGGGSIEDLWAFNEEVVARAIFHCRTPVISAVGHETDTTIADFVADLRAPTPSAAAELAVSDVRTLLGTFQEYRKKLERIMDNRLLLLEQQMKFYKNKLLYLSPENQIREKRTYLLELEARMDAGMQNQIYRARQELNLYIERMRGLSPLDKLNQGFSYVENEEQKAVTSISQVKTGDRLYIQVSDGTVEARAENRKKKSRGVSNGRKDNN
ncbi:MAG: exodeoxyribonuclease VII large subunit [Blautia sp.]|nr:exodeoxyribonuclease VII large subunit [Blautia sp.]